MKTICWLLSVFALAHDSHVWGEAGKEAREGAQQELQGAIASQQIDSPQFVIELRDGSRIVGIPSITSLPLQTSFAKMDIPLKHVGTVEFADHGATAKVSCANGDVLHGVPGLKTIVLKTSFDKASISVSEITRISALAGINSRGLALYYNFDSDEEKQVRDNSGNGHNGKVQNARHTNNGYLGGAYYFDGGCITAGDILNLDATESNLTVALWVKASPGTKESTLIAKQQEAPPFTGWGLYVASKQDTAGAALYARYPDQHISCFSGVVCDDQWHFVCSIYQVSEDSLTVTIYTDGKQYDSATCSGPHESTYTRSPLTIGSRTPNGGFRFEGYIDEVQVYRRALSSEEIRQLYNTAVSRHQAQIKSHD